MSDPVLELSASITEVVLDVLDPHPRNARGALKPDDVADLVSSIPRHGQLQPLIVTPTEAGDRFTVLAGHRRLAALKLLKSPTALVRLVAGEAGRLLELLIVENEARVDPDPLKESDLVAELLKQFDGMVSDVADALGKTVPWVARRANLRTLTPKARGAIAKAKRPWTAANMEDLALLSPAVQDDLARELRYIRGNDDLQRLIERHVHVLGKASWPLDDATLIPKAGACSTCPKQTLSAPGLFDDLPLDSGDIKKAACRDSGCWNQKRLAFIAAEVSRVRAEHKDLVLMHGDYESGFARVEVKGGTFVDRFAVRQVGKTTKGARPTLIVDGKDAGKLVYTSGAREQQPSKPAKKAADAMPDAGPSLAQRRTALRYRRDGWVVDQVFDAIEKMPLPEGDVVTKLILAYGVEPLRASSGGTPWLKTRHDAFCVPARRWQAEIWARMRPLVLASLERFGTADQVGRFFDLARWLGMELSIDVPALVLKAVEEIPEPKSWAALAKPAVKAKKAPPTAARKKAKRA